MYSTFNKMPEFKEGLPAVKSYTVEYLETPI